MSRDVVVHFDMTPASALRARIFGHSGVIIPFKEGIIAKKCRILRELQFYLDYAGWIHDILPSDLVPTVEGISESITDLSPGASNEVKISLKRPISVPNFKVAPYLILRDIAHGFQQPAVLDIKLGSRTWEFGTAPEKVRRMKGKCRDCPTAAFRFRIRAAMWHSPNPSKWAMDDGVNYVTRDFGNNCSVEELMEFLADFLHDPQLIPFFVKRLSDLKSALVRLRNERNARLFSSSVLFVYDEADPEKRECRILDFAKVYMDVDAVAERYNESLEDYEDDVIPAVSNLKKILSNMGNLSLGDTTASSSFTLP
jgi:1D-myo-inositol-tetrakisphosphate 5-kinase/inositol-polyphosphate multikinase